MSNTAVERRLEVPKRVAAPPRVFPRYRHHAVDLLCIEEPAAAVPARMHNRCALVLLRSPAIVRLESTRSIVADQNWILRIPPHHLYALRAPSGVLPGMLRPHVTLQLGASHPRVPPTVSRPALITDGDVGERLANLISQLQRPLRLAKSETSLHALVERIESESVPIGLARSGPAMGTLVAVRDYIRTHIDEQISTAGLSRFSGLTESHLIRAFHQEFGLPPHAYHLRLRLARACELLTDGLPVSSVAYECGFADQSHLSRKFKETYGLTPAAFARAAGAPNHAEPYSSR